ncbi:MAG: hypothetical protein OEZ58_14250 [Gammaproteobacteria bacterium]|nr:hypothetical protein [Gammaproteobacteria bacterium]MDH5730153.1 hypothetical protein [Gammaproteobacteria bacterium]
MGRSTKRLISYAIIVLVALLPFSMAQASIDCLFHDDNRGAEEVQMIEKMAAFHQNQFDLDIDFMADDTGYDQEGGGCTAGFSVTLGDSILNYSFDHTANAFSHAIANNQFVNAILPAEIKPPITA